MSQAVNGQHDKITRRKRLIRAFVSKAQAKRNFAEKFADYVTQEAGSVEFLLINSIFFLAWIIVNTELIPGVVPFDPFPFGLLTMIVSLEAIVLSIFVLLSQNRSSRIDSLREELHLQVNLVAEEEITKVLEILSQIRSKLGIKKEDSELSKMLERIDTSYIERSLEKQIVNTSSNILKPPLPSIISNQDGSQQNNKK